MLAPLFLSTLVGGAAAPVRLVCAGVSSTTLDAAGGQPESNASHEDVAVVVLSKTVEMLGSDHLRSGVTQPDVLDILSTNGAEVVAQRSFPGGVDVAAVNVAGKTVLWTRIRAWGFSGDGAPSQLTTTYRCGESAERKTEDQPPHDFGL